MKRLPFLASLVMALSTWSIAPAYAVYQCGPEKDECSCGVNNPFPCCDNGGNCTWWAWQSACCHWGVSVPMLGNANTWAGVAKNDPAYEVLSYPVANSIGCRASGEYGHVVWVKSVNGSTIEVSEMNCWGNYGVRDWTYQASYFDGGYIVLKSALCDCSSGEEQSQSCGDCGTQTRTCGSDCKWGAWGACDGPDPGGDCDTELLGVCAVGQRRCIEGNESCEQTVTPSEEVCDGLDNDCDGEVDEQGVCDNPGTGGMGGGGGSSGSGGTALGGSGGADGSFAGTGGIRPDGGSGDGAVGYDIGGDPEGCACAAVGTKRVLSAGWLVTMLLAAIGIGRRRGSVLGR